jgi:hypothetical protein
MTFGGILLYLVAGWLIVCWMVGWFLFKKTDRVWLAALAVLGLLWLPMWDLIPGLAAYNRAARELGGVRVHKSVVVSGFLDGARRDSDVLSYIAHSPYEYIELERTGATGLLAAMESGAGYYEYRLLPEDRPECAPFASLRNSKTLQRYFPGRCIHSIRRDKPISEFVYESSRGWQRLESEERSLPIEASWERVRDLKTGEVLAEAYRIRYISWLAGYIGIPQWKYPNTSSQTRAYFDPSEVLKPMKTEQNGR